MKKVIVIFLIVSFTFMISCSNPAAERLAENVWIDKDVLFIDNPLLPDLTEKELYLINVMQANGWTQEEIAEWIEKYRETQTKPQTKEGK